MNAWFNVSLSPLKLGYSPRKEGGEVPKQVDFLWTRSMIP